jgi:hypothetical protein
MTILVASLIAPPILDDPRRWGSWLQNYDSIKNSVPGVDVRYYCAVELDGRGLAPYRDVGWTDLIEQLGVEFETYTYNTGRTTLHTNNRLKHICLGRNIISQHAINDPSVTHIMGLDGDVTPPPNILPNLLELKYPLVSAYIPTYCFSAGNIYSNPHNHEQKYPTSWRVQPTQFSSAGAWLAERRVFSSLRWRTDPELRLSDDPSYLHDMRNVLGINPAILQRSDTIAKHWPESIGPIETRLTNPALVPLDA